MTDPHDKTTHFGYQQVPVEEKANKVADVFRSVAPNYDLMNDLMSLGIHRLWKHFSIGVMQLRPGHKVLDLAGGTGDLAMKISPKVGNEGEVVLADINDEMLRVGRDRLLDAGMINNIKVIQANAEKLPFPSNHFDRIIIGFGLRNVTDKDAALRSMFRVLKPGGQMFVLEFSKPVLPGSHAHDPNMPSCPIKIHLRERVIVLPVSVWIVGSKVGGHAFC